MSTLGFDVFVQLVMAAMTTEPCVSSTSLPSMRRRRLRVGRARLRRLREHLLERRVEARLRLGELHAVLRARRARRGSARSTPRSRCSTSEYVASGAPGAWKSPCSLKYASTSFTCSSLRPGEAQVAQRLGVDREDAAGRAVLGRHVGDGRAVGQRQLREAVAEELDELPDDALLAEHLGHGEHEVGRRRPLGQRARELHADDLRDEHRHGLAEHRRLGLDAADAPAEDAEAVDHRRVRVGPDERVGVDASCRRRSSSTTRAEVLEVHLVADARAGRHDLEVAEGALPPLEELVALAVAQVLELRVDASSRRPEPNASTCTEWSMTSSTGCSGLIFFGSPPSFFIASRIAARSTTAGTPVKSCRSTRAGVKAISRVGCCRDVDRRERLDVLGADGRRRPRCEAGSRGGSSASRAAAPPAGASRRPRRGGSTRTRRSRR